MGTQNDLIQCLMNSTLAHKPLPGFIRNTILHVLDLSILARQQKKQCVVKKLLEFAIKNNTTGGGSTTTLTADTAYHANTTCTAFTASLLKHCLLSGIHPCTWLGRSGINSIHRALMALGQKVGWVMDGYPLDCMTPKHMRC